MSLAQLKTLGTISLIGPRGAIALDEPGVAALLVLLAVASDAGVAGDELLLRLTPDATAEKGRLELERLVVAARRKLGSEAAIARTKNGYALAPDVLTLDVRVHAHAAASECAEFLAGFKLPGSPEFRDWVAETRRRVEPLVAVADSRAVGTPSRTIRRLTMTGCGVAVLAVGAYFASPRPASGFATGDPLLLADLANETGDSLFDVSLMSAASIALQQSGRLRLYSRSRLPYVFGLMKISNRDTALTFELSKDVAQRDGVRFVLGLKIDRANTDYRVTGRLVDVSMPDRIIDTSAIAHTKNDVLGALDAVLIAMRGHLGETRRDMEDRRVPLPWVTTASLEALRSYGDGSLAWSKRNYQLALELWRRAVDIDTGFAMAYGALANSYYFNHDRAAGEHYYDEAFKRADRLTERERLRLMEGRAEYRGQMDSATAYGGRLAVRYPSGTTWFNYGTGLLAARRDSEARAAFQTALNYEPKHAPTYINLAIVAIRMNRLENALEYYARAAQLDSSILYSGGLNHEWGTTFVRLGRYAEAESAFSRMSRNESVSNRALGFRSLGYLALWRGHPDQAADLYKQAVVASVQGHSALGEVRNRMLLATAYRTWGHDREAGEEIAKTLTIMDAATVEPQVLAMVAAVCVKAGRINEAASVQRLLRTKVNRERPVDAASEAYVDGLLAVAAHHPDSALQFARAIDAFPMNVLRLGLKAESFRLLGQSDSASFAVTQMMSDRGFGYEGQDDWLRAPLVLGDLLLARHDTASAIKQYQRLLDHWRAAPPELADVAAARTRIAALRGNSRP